MDSSASTSAEALLLVATHLHVEEDITLDLKGCSSGEFRFTMERNIGDAVAFVTRARLKFNQNDVKVRARSKVFIK
jgi:hypothetical protein